MEKNRAVSILLAVLAAILVIIAGKACTDDAGSRSMRSGNNEINTIGNNGKYAIEQVTTASSAAETETETGPLYEEVTNLIGEVVETIPVTSPAETEGEIVYEEVTNLIGEVIDRIPVTSPSHGVQTTAAATGTKSVLEAYEELHTTTADPNGNGESAETSKVEPATKIVIYLE